MPRCKHCKTKFEARFFNQKFCLLNPTCISASTAFAIQTVKNNFERQKRKETAVRKEAMMTHSEWLNLFQKVFNTFIRQRDKDNGCISCDKPLSGRKFDAGHYRSTSSAPHLRFDERNCHGQCVPCNQHQHGNLIEYRKNLVLKFGSDFVDELESENGTGKLSIPEIKDKIKEYKQKIKDLKC